MPNPSREGPNPLFTRWLQEWRDRAAENGRLRSQRAYERALCSLRKYPLPLHSGHEARILQYFGEKICRQLDEQLERHHSAQKGFPVPTFSLEEEEEEEEEDGLSPVLQPALSCTEPAQPCEQPHKKKQSVSQHQARGYVPAQHSAARAILVALYQNTTNPDSRGYLTKPELQRAAQPLCNKPFFLADPGSKSTAWSAVGTLIRKELVLKTNIPARYSLTEAGLTLARELLASEKPKENNSSARQTAAFEIGEPPVVSEGRDGSSLGLELLDLSPSVKSSWDDPKLGLSKPQFVFEPGQFDIILCVDFIETTGGPTSRKQDLVSELQRNNVPFSIRKLHVGDFLWVARERASLAAGLPQPTLARELVLDYIVERKRMSDLCGSIIDGRFHEQKFRLRQCGISHPIYLVEDSGCAQHLSLPEKTLRQAITNTQVIDGFFVKRTGDIRESAAYLTLMTRQLTRLHREKRLLSCTKEELDQDRPLQARSDTSKLLTFAEFNEGAVKNKAQTVHEVFARQLLQISGLSGDKAAAILERYKTPASLMAAYAACPTPESQAQLLSGIKCGKLQRNLGPSLSKTLAQLYCTSGPLP